MPTAENIAASTHSHPYVPRVLIVDEEPQLAHVMRLALELEGWEVCVAASNAEALARTIRFRPDAILLDLTLPDGHGADAIAELRRRGDQTPVIVVTGRDSLEDRLHAFGAGGDDYLTKPFGLDDLVRRLQAVLAPDTARVPS